MLNAIWGIIYDLPHQGRDDYLAWFHDTHMPEKLARPGYEWAAHYEVIDSSGNHVSSLGDACDGGTGLGYVALFWGRDTQVFLNPSPAQIKPHQPPLTRQMMGLRIGQRSFIAAQEWYAESDSNTGQRGHAFLQLVVCNTPDGDEAFGAWCVQELKPALLKRSALRRLSKMLATTGASKHVILAEFDISSNNGAPAASIAATQIGGSPLAARRIAPSTVYAS